MSAIEWTNETWNPTVGCSRVSAGCEHCYAERVAHRGMQEAHRGLTVVGKHGPRWTGEVRLLPERLGTPLRWRKARRVFVDSMSDLFHPSVPDGFILRVFEVMAKTPQHTYQVLTKRPDRAREWYRRWADVGGEPMSPQLVRGPAATRAAHPSPRGQMFAELLETMGEPPPGCAFPTFDWMEGMRWWPASAMSLPNVWLGVSVEDQATVDERIPPLLNCPAAVRFVSYEPALGPVDFGRFLPGDRWFADEEPMDGPISWIIVGGESGPGARPFDLAWARSTVAQCREASVPCFVKQLGARPFETAPCFGEDAAGYDPNDLLARSRAPRPPQMDGWTRIRTASGSHFARYPQLNSRKGGDPSEWPTDLRVREFPAPHGRTA